jgi:hypothetical protein
MLKQYKQETRYSCAPACLRMVLSAWGVDVAEAELRQLSDCSPLGTDAFRLVEAARALGFKATRKYTLASVDDLARLVDDGFYPIVYIDLWPISGGVSGQYHDRYLNLSIGVDNGRISLHAAELLVAEQRDIDAIQVLRDLLEYHERRRYQYLSNQSWEEPLERKTARDMIESILAERRSE